MEVVIWEWSIVALFFSKNNKTRMIFVIPNWKTSLFGYLYLQFSTLSSEWDMLPPLLKINLLWYIPLKQLLRQRYGELHSSEVNEIVILICLKHGDSSHKCISWITQQIYPLFFLQINAAIIFFSFPSWHCLEKISLGDDHWCQNKYMWMRCESLLKWSKNTEYRTVLYS